MGDLPVNKGERGVVLVFSLLMMLGIGAMAISMMQNAKHAQITAQNHKNRIRAFYAADGLRALLAQEVVDGNYKRYIDTGAVGEIEGQVYNGAGTLDALKAARGGAPSSIAKSDYLGSNWKKKADYGVVWSGYIIPPASGPYTFYVRADDAGEFYLSDDESTDKLSKVAIAAMRSFKSKWTLKWEKKFRYSKEEGDKDGTGVSEPISLKVGKRYYFEFLHVQQGGDGFGEVAWTGPKFITERPIPGKRLAGLDGKEVKWDTAMVGKSGRVRYSLRQAGPMVYTLSTEGMVGGSGDSLFRAPLNQTLSMLGDNPSPPDTLWQRVIFYDMHSNGSNPEFERGVDFYGGEVTPDLVQRKGLRYTTENAAFFGLDSIGKPIRGPAVKWTCGVEKWFNPWKPGWTKTYPYAGGSGDCTEAEAGHDRAFENRVIMDSLPFLKRADLGANAYQFKRIDGPGMAFAPLDGRGFGNEGKVDEGGTPRNFSFCMELHTQFEHTSGMSFEFNGDDDVWLFINDSLVMDLGFLHLSTYASVNLDDLPLKFGETYPLDFFYCERQSTGSSIDLITNLPVLLVKDKPVSSWKREYGEID